MIIFASIFAYMTKEMRPSHRIDVLCNALTLYGIIAKEKLSRFLNFNVIKHLNDGLNVAILLLIRWKRTLKTEKWLKKQDKG